MMPSGYLVPIYEQLTHMTFQGPGDILQIKLRDKLKGCLVGDMHEAKMLSRKMLRHHLDHLSSMSDDQVYMSDRQEWPSAITSTIYHLCLMIKYICLIIKKCLLNAHTLSLEDDGIRASPSLLPAKAPRDIL
jgi:hypothetical protein